jgi:hypothetical protein
MTDVDSDAEDRVRELLRGAAADVQPTSSAGDGWADVEERAAAAETRGPRRFRLGLLAAAAAVVVAGAAVAVLRNEGPATRVTTPAGPSTTAAGPKVSTDPAPAWGGPATFVGTAMQSTQVVVASSITGKTVRVLAEAGGGSPIVDSLSLTPDGKFAYFSVGPEPMVGELRRVPVAGGPVEHLGPGTSPVVSPDGRTLAYVLGTELVVKDFSSDAGESYSAMEGYFVSDPTWLADGSLLFEQHHGSTGEWMVIDRALSGPARRLDPSTAGDNGWFSPDVRRSDGLIGFLETDKAHAVSLVVVDPATGKVKGRTAVGAGLLRQRYDATGRYQLFVGQTGRLYRRSGGALTPVPGDFAFADF